MAIPFANYTFLPATVAELNRKLRKGIVGERFAGGKEPRASAAVPVGQEATVAPPGFLMIPFFGKMHYVSLPVFQRDADKFNLFHLKESFFLLDEIHDNRTVYDEWRHPVRFFDRLTADTVDNYDDVKRKLDQWFRDVDASVKPDPAEFDRLADRGYKILHRIVACDLSPKNLTTNGTDLQLLCVDLKKFVRLTLQWQERSIQSAGEITDGLNFVEGTSFQLLNIVPMITLMDPLREAAYKLSMLVIRASAHGVGGWTAYGTFEAAENEAIALLYSEGPGVIVDVVMLPMNRVVARTGMKPIAQEAMKDALRCIFDFGRIWFEAFRQNNWRSMTEEQWRDVFEQAALNLVHVLFNKLLGPGSRSIGDTALRAMASTLVRELTIEARNCAKEAQDQGREISEVALGNLPWLIMRIVQGTIVGFFDRRAGQARQHLENQNVRFTREERKAAGREVVSSTSLRQFLFEGTFDAPTVDTIRKAQAQAQAGWASKPQTGKASKEQESERKTPIAPMTYKDYRERYSELNYDYFTVAKLRRYANNFDNIIIGMIPKANRSFHTDSPEARGAKAPKPIYIRAKTANHPSQPRERLGLVVKPIDAGQPGGPTHSNMDTAKASWAESKATMFAKGYMVREDGVVFHPDQVLAWAKLNPGLAEPCQSAVRLLKEVRGHTSDLNDPSTYPRDPVLRRRLESANKFLASVKMGFYTDIDLADVIDCHTGDRVFMGSMNDDRGHKQFARDNREHRNRELGFKDFEPEDLPPDVKKLARHTDQLQHGVNYDEVTYDEDGRIKTVLVKLDNVFLMTPDGQVRTLNEKNPLVQTLYNNAAENAHLPHADRVDRAIRMAGDLLIEEYLGSKYQDEVVRGAKVRRQYDNQPVKYRAAKAPPPLKPKDVYEANAVLGKIEILDEPGLGTPVDYGQVFDSFIYRRLREYGLEHLRWWVKFDHKRLEKACQDHRTIVGYLVEGRGAWGQRQCRNVVIAVVQYKQTVAQALEGLVQTREAMGDAWDAGIRLWLEVYTAYNPIVSDGIANLLGEKEVRPVESLGPYLSCFAKRTGERLYSFATAEFQPIFTPPHDPDYRRNIAPMFGLTLAEVWEKQEDRSLTYRQSKAPKWGCSYISVLPAPIFAIPPS